MCERGRVWTLCPNTASPGAMTRLCLAGGRQADGMGGEDGEWPAEQQRLAWSCSVTQHTRSCWSMAVSQKCSELRERSMAGKQCTLWNDLPGLPEESWPGLGPRRRPRWAPRTVWWPSPSSEHYSLSPRGFLVRPEDGRNDREQLEPQCHRAPYRGNSQEAQHLRRALRASRGQLGRSRVRPKCRECNFQKESGRSP